MSRIYLFIVSIFCFSCMGEKTPGMVLVDTQYVYSDQITPDKKMDRAPMHVPLKMPQDIWCDLDGDGSMDTVGLRLDTHKSKYGIVIQYATGTCDTLGMAKEFLDRGFDDFNWVGIMEVAPKGKFYWNYVNYQDQNIPMDQVEERDKIILKRDAIFLHADEACGGGVIYLTDTNEYAWMQQE